MSLPIIIIRPQPGTSQTLASARDAGLDAHAFPLFTVGPLVWEPVPAEQVDALLLGSANAIRHGGSALADYRHLPVLAVGQKTAAAAREAGFHVAGTGRGGLQSLLGAPARKYPRLLRLAGRERVTLSIPQGVSIFTREVYASSPLPLPASLTALLAGPAVILLHSGEAAAHFASECSSQGIDRAKLRLAAIGPRVAARAGDGWALVRSAPSPDDAALLALAADMCQ